MSHADDWYLAPALVQLRDEINKLWPKRDKASDGAIGDRAHAARKSEHNPEADGAYKGRVNAIDVDKDGIDVEAVLDVVKADPRTWYVIWDGHIYSRTHGFAKRVYNGSNKHDKHFHVSIYPGKAEGESKAAWGVRKAAPKPTPKPKPAKPATGKLVALDSTVKPGKRAPQVAKLQSLLIKAGYGPIKGAYTTFYGPNTQAAVARFHDKHPHLKSVGVKRDVAIGPKGWELLQREVYGK